MTRTKFGRIPSSCLLEEIYSRFRGRLWVLRLLGWSQQEGVATCLLSVLLQPSCGPALVDFAEITWHPHHGWLQGGSASARTLLRSARTSSSSASCCCLYPLLLQKKRLGSIVFEHTENMHRYQNSLSLISLLFFFLCRQDWLLLTSKCYFFRQVHAYWSKPYSSQISCFCPRR